MQVLVCLKCDFRDLTVHDLVGFDAVIHLAALSNDPTGAIDPKLTIALLMPVTVPVKAGLARTFALI